MLEPENYFGESFKITTETYTDYDFKPKKKITILIDLESLQDLNALNGEEYVKYLISNKIIEYINTK